MEPFTLANGGMATLMEKANLTILMDAFIMVIGLIIRRMVMESI